MGGNRVAKLTITCCDDCRFAKTSRAYTPDSFEQVRKIHCTALGKDVHSYLDWNETGKVPHECPYGVEES